MSRQAYYQGLDHQDEVRQCNERVIALVRSERLRQSHMMVSPKRAYHKTTNRRHRFRRHPNLLKAGHVQVQANAVEQV